MEHISIMLRAVMTRKTAHASTALGGTLFQLIIPITFVVYFWRRHDRYAAGFALWWVAQNLWNISVYIADARTQELPQRAHPGSRRPRQLSNWSKSPTGRRLRALALTHIFE